MVTGTPARSASSRWLISVFSRASCKSAADGDGSFSTSCGCVMTRSYDVGVRQPESATRVRIESGLMLLASRSAEVVITTHVADPNWAMKQPQERSEEHTSELQSPCNLV